MTEIAATTIDNLRATTTATLTTQLFRRGFRNAFLQGVRPLKRYEANLVGPAFTLRYIPAREDLDAYGANPDPNALQREAIEAVPPGHVLVMDCRGEARVASAGDIYMTRLRAKGVAGVVSDGGIRDTTAIEKLELPVYCAVPSAPPNRILHHTLDYNRPIGCGGVAVYPGDIVVGDADGVVIIPRAIADEVAREAAEQERMEAYIQRRVADGEKLPGLYPANDAVRAQYEKWRAGQSS
jgi:regulator of RNase E activity RraA